MALADLEPGQHAPAVRNHWWWRPGWETGRRFYAFHVTFEGQPELYRLIDGYRQALAETQTVTLIPDRWLHLTMQGVGFADEIEPRTVARIADEARAELARAPSVEAKFEGFVVADEAIVVPAEPPEPIRSLRSATRKAIGHVLCAHRVSEDPQRFRPHVSAAYIRESGSAEPYIAALRDVRPEPAHVRVRHIDLIEMHRDREMYEWRAIEKIPLAGS